MNNCIFCNIINKTLPTNIIYEDEYCLAFLDITQVTKGHTLIVPKKHYHNILDADEETLINIMKVIHKLSNHYVSKLGINNINILNNSGTIAGQTVNHLHFHLIPRYDENDSISINFKSHNKNIDKESLSNLLKI